MLEREFFARATVDVARDLVGCVLEVDAGTSAHVSARVVEVEAYLGLGDPASHAYRGPTPRAAIMFGEPGHLYVYFSYGVHHCANLVTESRGTAGAVLLRAASVEAGEDTVRLRRGGAVPREALLRGPGNLCRGLGISLLDNGLDVCSGDARLSVSPPASRPRITVSRRVGITAAADRALRFAWDGHAAVSAPRPGREQARRLVGTKKGTG
ncbi:MAG: DNA-3-methyladenine glycosylase [Candidatus Dormibacteraeota bacterium]|nr:DNA-3-methyladenine glycosylase [Candidatus Dormibacteraeota bacterium]MBV9525245.1 DNA-3-methyladenine glycosylase [Candidatus Dormibacteraeota bacterium]